MIFCPTNLDDITLWRCNNRLPENMFLSGTVPAETPIIIHAGDQPSADASRPLSFWAADDYDVKPSGEHSSSALNNIVRHAVAKIVRTEVCRPGQCIPASDLQFSLDYERALAGQLEGWRLQEVLVYSQTIELCYRAEATGQNGCIVIAPEASRTWYPSFGIPGEGPDGSLRTVWIRAIKDESSKSKEQIMQVYASGASDKELIVSISRVRDTGQARIEYYRKQPDAGLVSKLLGDGLGCIAL